MLAHVADPIHGERAETVVEMAYNRGKANQVITGLERPFNDHLIKLMVVAANDTTRDHWIREIGTWLAEIASIRLKPTGRPAPARFYYQILYDEPFGGVEQRNIRARIFLISETYPLTPEVDVEAIFVRLRRFHERLSGTLAEGIEVVPDRFRQTVRDLLTAL